MGVCVEVRSKICSNNGVHDRCEERIMLYLSSGGVIEHNTGTSEES
jgi:hypothetical protein